VVAVRTAVEQARTVAVAAFPIAQFVDYTQAAAREEQALALVARNCRLAVAADKVRVRMVDSVLSFVSFCVSVGMFHFRYIVIFYFRFNPFPLVTVEAINYSKTFYIERLPGT
jgi:hypothetical protein